MDSASVSYDSHVKPASLSGLGLILVGFTILYFLYLSGYAIYNVYFHPLHGIPGPKTWIALPLLCHLASVRGLLDQNMRKFHELYGQAVRFSPEEVSFITAQAWKDIYGHGHKQLPKRAFPNNDQPPNIITSNDEDHARFRKSLSPAFSEKALRAQEPLMNVYIDLMVEKLKGVAASDQPTDMVKWYNLTTFDMIGDLAFGESFNGLSNNTLHSWVSMIFQSIKFVTFLRISKKYPFIMKVLVLSLPKSLTEARKEHSAYTRKVVMKRVHDKALQGRPDFMESMLKHRGDKDGLADAELVSNSAILIVAGSETTATLLSGATYWLLRTPHALQRVTNEVRCAFEHEEEINFANTTARLPYMLACLEEGFRMFPPVPAGLPRQTLPGPPTHISGYQIPAGTFVSVHPSAAYSSARNFHLPHSYIPERWLPSATNDINSPFYNDNRAVLQPFSVGPRNCIGRNLAYNEMRLILARVLWNFDIELCDQSVDWNEQKSYVLWEKPELWCKLSSRTS